MAAITTNSTTNIRAYISRYNAKKCKPKGVTLKDSFNAL